MLGLIVLLILFISFFLLLYLCRRYAKLTLGICCCTRQLKGKTVLVTGSSKGIGYWTAKNLAERGARVIITSRSLKRSEKTKEKLINATGNTNIVAKSLDYTSLKNVRKFVEDILQTENRLDILINNACNPGYGYRFSAEGNLLTLQLNYFGPFLLTNLLLDLIKKTPNSRIINVTSSIYEFGCYDHKNINNYRQPYYIDHLVYTRAKLFIMYMTLYLATKLNSTGTTVNCLHPGVSQTSMVENVTAGYIPFNKIVWKYLIGPICNFGGFKTPEEAAQTSIHLAVSDKVENITGTYFADCQQFDLTIDIEPGHIKNVWDQSLELVGL